VLSEGTTSPADKGSAIIAEGRKKTISNWRERERKCRCTLQGRTKDQARIAAECRVLAGAEGSVLPEDCSFKVVDSAGSMLSFLSNLMANPANRNKENKDNRHPQASREAGRKPMHVLPVPATCGESDACKSLEVLIRLLDIIVLRVCCACTFAFAKGSSGRVCALPRW
jgi:hypothetical protein